MGYSATLVFSSMTALMTRAFYSIHDSKNLLAAVILYLLNVIFRNLTGIGIAGTALIQ